jgi:hypothetical protein
LLVSACAAQTLSRNQDPILEITTPAGTVQTLQNAPASQSAIGPMTSFGDMPKEAQDAMRQLEVKINEMSTKLQTVGQEYAGRELVAITCVGL